MVPQALKSGASMSDGILPVGDQWIMTPPKDEPRGRTRCQQLPKSMRADIARVHT